MAFGDFLNTFLASTEHRGVAAPMAHETLQHRYGDLSWAVRNVMEVIPPLPVAPQPESAPQMNSLHTEIARSAIKPVETEAVSAPTAAETAEDKRVDDLMADIYAIHDEHSLEVARMLEDERRQKDEYGLAA